MPVPRHATAWPAWCLTFPATTTMSFAPGCAGSRRVGLSHCETAPTVRPMGSLLESVGPGSTYLKLMKRELSHWGNRRFQRTCQEEKYRNFSLRGFYDTNEDLPGQMTLQFLTRRSRIVEILAQGGLIFALAHSGACAAFSRATGKLVCFLNVNEDEVIRSLFYNKNNNSLITVSVYASDNFSTLKCRSTSLECIHRKELDKGVPLFTTESLKWPGFVEFDDVNSKVLTFNACDKVYKVFDLRDYRELYQIRNDSVTEIKISPGIMLLIMEEGVRDGAGQRVPLQILNIETGEVLKALDEDIDPKHGSKVDFIEQFNEKLLVKQEHGPLTIRDVRTGELTTVPSSQFVTPNAFIFLYENQLFLTFRDRNVEVWNFRGEQVTTFEDHVLWHSDCNTNNIYITSSQDLIISYCHSGTGPPARAAVARDGPNPKSGTINISSIMTGKCLAKIEAPQPCGPEGIAVEEALTDVTALFYDEQNNEIYTGNRNGVVHVWSNSFK